MCNRNYFLNICNLLLSLCSNTNALGTNFHFFFFFSPLNNEMVNWRAGRAKKSQNFQVQLKRFLTLPFLLLFFFRKKETREERRREREREKNTPSDAIKVWFKCKSKTWYDQRGHLTSVSCKHLCHWVSDMCSTAVGKIRGIYVIHHLVHIIIESFSPPAWMTLCGICKEDCISIPGFVCKPSDGVLHVTHVTWDWAFWS